MNIDTPARNPRTSIVENIRRMPTWLRLMTCHALVCFVLVLVAVIPGTRYQLGGSMVSHAQWWASGAGPLVAVAGLNLTAAGVLFLLRRGFGRYLYLANFAGALVGWQLYRGQLLAAALGAIFVGALGAYLFRNDSVRGYFAR